jgi:xylose dehydrogenase (NAD/NADP)
VGLHWGILSTARINETLLTALAAGEGGQARAVASRDGERAGAYASAHGIERAYGSYEELLEDPGIDAIYISAPNSLHPEWTRRALQAGRHVLCEKPLTRSADEARAMFDLAQERKLVLMEAFMYRHHPQTARLVTLLSEGVIGRPRAITASFGFRLDDPKDPRMLRSLGGGSLMDVGCYCVNVIRMLAGEPDALAAQQVVGGDGVDIAFSGLMRIPGDVLAHFDCGFVFADRYGMEVVGEDGSLLVADPFHCQRPGITLRAPDGREEEIAVPVSDHYRAQVENFAGAVRGEATPLLGRTDAVGQARVLEDLYAAAGATA